MVERFFESGSIRMSSSDEVTMMMLLSGPPSCGKTSLLFQFALNVASLEKQDDNPTSIVFICNSRRLQNKPPFLAQGIDPSSDLFHCIQMKYIHDYQGLKKYFSAFHLHDSFPRAVIVDDFADFFDARTCQEQYGNPRGRDMAMVRVLALCHNAITHANKTAPCNLLLSDTQQGDAPRLLYLYKRWVSSIFTIKGHGSGSFLLRYNSTCGGDGSGRTRFAKYSVALQYLVLEEITENDGEQL